MFFTGLEFAEFAAVCDLYDITVNQDYSRAVATIAVHVSQGQTVTAGLQACDHRNKSSSKRQSASSYSCKATVIKQVLPNALPPENKQTAEQPKRCLYMLWFKSLQREN